MKQFKLQLTIVFIVFSTLATAQTDKFKKAFEIGFFGGGSYYIGDINPTKHFIYSKPAGGLIMRYNLSTRHSMRFTATYGNVYGNDAMSSDDWQVNRNLNFSSEIYEVAAGFEICLKKYAINNMRYTFTPYLFYELAYFRMNPKTSFEGNEVFLQGIGTEGQGSVLSNKNNYSLNQVSVPLGVGFKFNLMKRVAISLEYGIRMTFTDYLDDVSGSYVNNTDFANLRGPMAAQLADPSLNGISNVPGAARGNASTKDWYSFYGAMITFKPWKYNVCAFSHF